MCQDSDPLCNKLQNYLVSQNINSSKIKLIATEQKNGLQPNLDDFDVGIIVNFDDLRLFKLTEQILETDSINLLLLVKARNVMVESLS